MKRKLILLLFLFGATFPLNWLVEESAFFHKYFYDIFIPEWMHIIGHLFLFGMLSYLLLNYFKRPINLRTFIYLISAILIIGGIQEILQLPTKGRAFGWPEVFDLGVDLIGGSLGLFYYLNYQRREKSKHRNQSLA